MILGGYRHISGFNGDDVLDKIIGLVVGCPLKIKSYVALLPNRDRGIFLFY